MGNFGNSHRWMAAFLAAAMSGGVGAAVPLPLSATLALPDGGFTAAGTHGFAPATLDGKIVVLTLASTSCGITCATKLIDLDATARSLPPALRRRVAFVAVVVDAPESPRALARLAKAWRLDPSRWAVVAAPSADMPALRRRIEVSSSVTGAPSEIVALYDGRGALRQRYDGGTLDRGRMAREIAALDSMTR